MEIILSIFFAAIFYFPFIIFAGSVFRWESGNDTIILYTLMYLILEVAVFSGIILYKMKVHRKEPELEPVQDSETESKPELGQKEE